MAQERRSIGRRAGGPLVVAFALSSCTGSTGDSAALEPGGTLTGAEATAPIPSPTRAAASTTPPPPSTAPASTPVMSTSLVPDGSVVSAHAGADWFLGTVPSSATAADDALEPIMLGMINQEDTPVGSYPEVRAAVEAGVEWVNTELGGVNGRPVELRTCIAPFDAQRSRTCAEDLADAGVVALVGGVDVLSEGSIAVVEERGLISVGGIPASLAQQRSPNSFFFSGGDAGALAAFMARAAEHGAGTVTLAYAAEVESFEVAARDYGAAVGRSLGLDVRLTPFSLFDTDYTPVMRAAQQSGAEAVVVLAATSACVAVVEAARAVDLDAQLYMTGACTSEATVEAAAEAGITVVWNAEGAVDGVDVEASLYQAVIDRYADEPAGGAGTVGFRGFMNLYALLLEAGEDVSSAELVELARASVDRPSFWGHPYTCDGEQVPALPALCAPQQVLFTIGDDGRPVSLTGWIATDVLFADALG